MHLKAAHMMLGMSCGIAALGLMGAPALALAGASGGTAGQAVTGPESAYGVIYGKPATADIPTIPLTWRGMVNTDGTFSGGHAPHKGDEHTFTTPAGKLVILVTARPVSGQTFSPQAWHFSATTDVTFTVVGSKSTGRFAGASGPGAARVYFAGYMPKYASGPKKGRCDTSQNAPELAKGAVVSVLFSIVMTTP